MKKKYSFSEEIMESIILLFISVFFTLWNWLMHFEFDDIYILLLQTSGVEISNIYFEIMIAVNKYFFAILCGALVYVAVNRTYRILILFLIPCMSYIIGYVFVNKNYDLFTEYIGGIVLVLGIVIISKSIALIFRNNKTYASIIYSTIFAIILLLSYVYIVLSAKTGMNGSGDIWNYIYDNYLFHYTFGISATNLLLSLIYNENYD